MANGKRMVALAIGVSDAKRLRYLRGALNSATEFAKWATAFGYEAKLLTDETEPVTIPRLRAELDGLLQPAAKPIHRLLLYFAGHGLIREAEEGLWLLSDWYDEFRAVAVEGLRRKLYLHGINQIAIFADACRSLPASIEVSDLIPDHVLGRGPVGRMEPAIDKFIAAQDGAEAFAIPGPNPEDDRCLFSGVLLEGLWGTKPNAFSKLLKDKVTSRSLAEYLKAEVPPLAKRYRLTLVPSVSPTFPEGDDVYFGDGATPMPPAFPAWPADGPISRMNTDEEVERPELVSHGYLTSVSPKMNSRLMREILRSEFSLEAHKRSVQSILRDQPRPPSFETGAGFAVAGRSVRAVWTPADVFAESHGQANWWRLGQLAGYQLARPVPFLIEFDDGLFLATTAIPRFISTVLRDQRGVSALIYREIGTSPEIATSTENAIATMESGVLLADTLTDLAVELRQGKHADPVRGVISAYLYESIGDIDNIRRMAFYYIQHNQPIPYDIALLAHLQCDRRNDGLLWAEVPAVPKRKPRTGEESKYDWTYEATSFAKGVVGGFWPWMRQGWTFCDDAADGRSALVTPGLTDLIRDLTSGRFATLNALGGQRLAKLFNLVRRTGR
ncbi:MAG: hypothetical protein EPO55_12805 [Reyranella sp.]|uniref:caspase family protein n=1 Tax=Reyranella sp. TaxID=1929291 RepID=UPI001221F7A3|nr:caspase family protein [Reyranella sp.]TAJ39330.1 MAG: hypothetical protein EPO55_12805 [Reyranella sp.]